MNKSYICTYNQAIVKITDVDEKQLLTSPWITSEFKTYSDYYYKKYNVNFEFEDQFLVVSEKKYKNGLNPEKIERNYYPPELLKPTGLTDKMRTNFHLMRKLGEHTIV